MMLPIAIYLARHTGRKRWGLCAAIVGLGALATVSRTSVTMLVALTLVWLWLRPKEVKNLYAQVRGFDSWGGQINQSDLLPGMALAQAPRLKRRPCLWTFNLMVMYDGLVRACSCRFTGTERVGTDGLLVGNLQKQNLTEIWNGDAIRNLRRTFENGTLHDVCRSCTMYRSV